MNQPIRMNILLLTNKSPWPPRDGGSFATLAMARGLCKSGARVTVLAMNTSKHPIVEQDIPENIRQEMDLHLIPVNTGVNFFKAAFDLIDPGLPYIARRFLNRHFKKKLMELLSTEAFDVVQLEGLYLTPYISDIRKSSNARIVFRPHNVEHEIWYDLSRNETHLLNQLYLRVIAKKVKGLESRMMNHYDLLVPITERDLSAFQSLGNQKPSLVCPTGVSHADLPETELHKDVDSLFYIGALDWKPNREGLMWFLHKVWTPLKSKHPDLIFRIAGRNAPDWLIDNLNIQDILYEGEVEDSAEFMSRGGIMIAPLFSGSGLRIKILEAMSLGVPIVATSASARGLPLNHKEHLMIADTADQFAAALANLLSNPDTCLRLGKNARSLALQEFDNFVLTNALLHFFKTHS
jgi:polysaccharide biosynthesis protein PslH